MTNTYQVKIKIQSFEGSWEKEQKVEQKVHALSAHDVLKDIDSIIGRNIAKTIKIKMVSVVILQVDGG